MSIQKILIDTDPGQDIDDLLAILFALLRPELDVKAITTVTWPSDGRARLVKRLLRYMGRTSIPVSAGIETPLRPMSDEEIRRQRNFSQAMNHAAFAEPEDPTDAPNDLDAVGRIIRTVEENPGEIVLACLAPLTNIASALQRKPEIANKISYIAMMGGETTLNRIENNVVLDYIAADIVLSSKIPVYMGTWDVTRRFVLSQKDCDLFRESTSPLYQAIGKAIDLWHPAQSWKPGPVMYDIFPIIWSFDRSFYTTKPMPIKVETKGEVTCGMTVVRSNYPEINVSTDIRADALRQLYLDTVFGNMGDTDEN